MAERIQRRRTKGWRLPAGAACVTRPGLFGNPYLPGAPGRVQMAWHRRDSLVTLGPGLALTAAGAVARYRAWLAGEPLCWVDVQHADGTTVRAPYADIRPIPAWRTAVLSALPLLRGRDLACWCPPGAPCHADVLLELANR